MTSKLLHMHLLTSMMAAMLPARCTCCKPLRQPLPLLRRGSQAIICSQRPGTAVVCTSRQACSKTSLSRR